MVLLTFSLSTTFLLLSRESRRRRRRRGGQLERGEGEREEGEREGNNLSNWKGKRERRGESKVRGINPKVYSFPFGVSREVSDFVFLDSSAMLGVNIWPHFAVIALLAFSSLFLFLVARSIMTIPR